VLEIIPYVMVQSRGIRVFPYSNHAATLVGRLPAHCGLIKLMGLDESI
jgi:hypothetical protein